MDGIENLFTMLVENDMVQETEAQPEVVDAETDNPERECTPRRPINVLSLSMAPGTELPLQLSAEYSTESPRAESSLEFENVIDPNTPDEFEDIPLTPPGNPLTHPDRPKPGPNCRTWPRLQVVPPTAEPVECPICRNEIGTFSEDKYKEFAVRTKCGHVFGSDCLFEWCQPYVQRLTRLGASPYENLPTCPMCRQELSTDDIFADGSFCVECEQGGHSLSNKSGPLVEFENGNTGHEVLDSKKTWLCVGFHTLRRIRAGHPDLLAKYATKRERLVVPQQFEQSGWLSGGTEIRDSP
jgi:hypothetical protein